MEKTEEYRKALLELFNDIESIKKGEKNPFYSSSYVPLPKMLEILKPIYKKHNFILSQPTEIVVLNDHVINVVTSKLTHSNTGLYIESRLAITPDLLQKADMQKLGGAITYARRYTLSALNALEEIDDDGNAASGKSTSKKSTDKSTTSKKSKPSFKPNNTNTGDDI